MITLTKEWLLKTIAELEEERDATQGAVNEDAALALAAMKRALASLMTEPDYYVVVTSVGVWQSFCKTKAEAEFIVSKPFNPGYSILEIYTAPPAPEFYKIGDATMRHIFTPTGITDVSDMQAVFDQIETVLTGMWQPAPVSVPDALPENDDEEGNDIDYMEPSEVYIFGRTAGWNACRAAMLQGVENAETPTTMQTAPALDSSPKIAESPTGINQGKSEPVTTANKLPDGYVLVPVEPTEEMIAAAMCSNDVLFDSEDDTMFRVQHTVIWRAMLAAAPQQEDK